MKKLKVYLIDFQIRASDIETVVWFCGQKITQYGELMFNSLSTFVGEKGPG
jgi:hypothetical protein